MRGRVDVLCPNEFGMRAIMNKTAVKNVTGLWGFTVGPFCCAGDPGYRARLGLQLELRWMRVCALSSIRRNPASRGIAAVLEAQERLVLEGAIGLSGRSS